MAFMEPEITLHGIWYEVDTRNNGIEFIPWDVVVLPLPIGCQIGLEDDGWEDVVKSIRDYVEGDPQSIRCITGVGARLSAPGYLDATPWSVFETEAEAQAYLEEETADDSDDEEDSVDLVLAYIGDGYLAAVMTSEEYESTQWGPDIEQEDGFEEATASNVPRELADKLLKQGSSDQHFSDGYDAANAVSPYVKESA